MKKKKILILGGGISKEREISLETARQVNNVLKKKYQTLLSEPNDNLVKNVKKFKPDLGILAITSPLAGFKSSKKYFTG